MVPLKMESGGGGSGSLPRPHRCFVDVRGVGEGRLRKGAEPRSHAAREAGRDVKSRGVFPGWLWQSVSAVSMKRGRTSAENAPLSPAKSQGRARARLTCGGRAARFQR